MGIDGKYEFSGLLPGSYTVVETNPPKYIDFSARSVNVTLAPSNNKVVNFVDTLPASISGNVTDTFNDPLL
jgi:uncharacterized surface anchored protein